MATPFQPKRINLEEINNGNKFEVGQNTTTETFNAPIEASAYAQEIVENFTSNVDNSEANNVGTAEVEIIRNGSNANFKFKNLKGERGEAGVGATVVSEYSTNPEEVYNTEYINNKKADSYKQIDNTDTFNSRVMGSWSTEIVDGLSVYPEKIEGNSVEQDIINGNFVNIGQWKNNNVPDETLLVEDNILKVSRTMTGGLSIINNQNSFKGRQIQLVEARATNDFIGKELIIRGGTGLVLTNEFQLFYNEYISPYALSLGVVGEGIGSIEFRNFRSYNIDKLGSISRQEAINLLKDIPYTEGEINTKIEGITTTGKNLFIPNNVEQGGMYYNKTGKFPSQKYSTSARCRNANLIKYTMKSPLKFISNNNDLVYGIQQFDKDLYPISDSGWLFNYDYELTILPETEYIWAGFRYADNSNITPQDVYDANFMIYISGASPEYEPYKESTLELPTQLTLKSYEVEGNIIKDYLDVTNEKLYSWNGTQYDVIEYPMIDKSYIGYNYGIEKFDYFDNSTPPTYTAKYNMNLALQVEENSKELVELRNEVEIQNITIQANKEDLKLIEDGQGLFIYKNDFMIQGQGLSSSTGTVLETAVLCMTLYTGEYLPEEIAIDDFMEILKEQYGTSSNIAKSITNGNILDNIPYNGGKCSSLGVYIIGTSIYYTTFSSSNIQERRFNPTVTIVDVENRVKIPVFGNF